MSEPRPGKPVVIGDLVIEPVERTIVRVEIAGRAMVAVALKEPVSVVIRSPSGTWTVDLEPAQTLEPLLRAPRR